MFTYFLGREEVSAYCGDLVQRLDALGELFPRIWCPLGSSGEEIAVVVAESLSPTRRRSVQVVPLRFDRTSRAISFHNFQDKSVVVGEVPVLLIDGSVHSGTTMLAAFQELAALGARNICSYSLVVKRGACFVPNFFGLIMQEHDRAYFLLGRIPNNRTMPFGALRRLTQEDTTRSKSGLTSGLPSLDKVTWSDLWYESQTKGANVFVYEQNGEILGFVSFIIRKERLFVDAVAVEKKSERQGIGGALLRWAETCARTANCHSIELWSKNDRLDFYKSKGGFTAKPEKLDLGGEGYTHMERRILYNLESYDPE